MTGFEPGSSGIGSDRSAICATTTALAVHFYHCVNRFIFAQPITFFVGIVCSVKASSSVDIALGKGDSFSSPTEAAIKSELINRWLWFSWQSCRLWRQGSAVRILSIYYCFSVNCIDKTIKEKDSGNSPLKKKRKASLEARIVSGRIDDE